MKKKTISGKIMALHFIVLYLSSWYTIYDPIECKNVYNILKSKIKILCIIDNEVNSID